MQTNEKLLTAENAVAGSILVDARCMKLLPSHLEPKDFQDETSRVIFRAAKSLALERKPIDPVTICNWAQEENVFLSPQEVASIMDHTPSAANAGVYGRMVLEASVKRQMDALLKLAAGDKESTSLEKTQLLMQNMQRLRARLQDNLLICAADVPYTPPRWLIEPYIQRGKGTLIQADPGTGKTAFVCGLVAAVTTGRPILNLKVETPGDVLMLSTEDDISVLRGRIEASGGDLKRVHFMNQYTGITMQDPQLAEWIWRYKAKLLVLDPFQAFLGDKVDMFRANETRPVLTKLFEMCDYNDCACIIVAHLGKVTQGKNAVNQSLGSVDIPGAMRSILHVARNPACRDELFAFHVKSSNAAAGKAIVFTIGQKGRVEFQGFSEQKLEDLYKTGPKEVPFEQDPLVELLNRMAEARPLGSFWSNEDIYQFSVKIQGTPAFVTSNELTRRTEHPEFASQMLNKCGLRIVTRQRSGGQRGLRLERYQQPQGYQTQLPQMQQLPTVPKVARQHV